MNTTTKTTLNDRINRRAFLRWGGFAAAGLAVLLAGCGTPAHDDAAAVSAADEESAPTQDRAPSLHAAAPTPQPALPQERVA
jgi:hypothetical protein